MNNAGLSELVSIIVPVYNVEKYLEKCLNSIISQTYKNIEIIIVNDGSPDNSEKIINRYVENDKRIIYISQTNMGLGGARNTGLKIAKGEYVCFIDSDDWIRQDYVEKMLTRLRKDNADIAICNMKYVYSDGSQRQRTPKITKEEVIDRKEAIKREFIGKEYKFHVPNKFFKRALFFDNDIVFPKEKLYEDVMTTYRLLLVAKRISLIPEELYYYLQSREGSIMYASLKRERFDDMYLALNEIVSNPSIKALKIEPEVTALFASNIISLANYIYPLYGKMSKSQSDSYKELLLNPLYTKYMEAASKYETVSKIDKVRLYMIRKCFCVYCILMRILKGMEGRLH